MFAFKRCSVGVGPECSRMFFSVGKGLFYLFVRGNDTPRPTRATECYSAQRMARLPTGHVLTSIHTCIHACMHVRVYVHRRYYIDMCVLIELRTGQHRPIHQAAKLRQEPHSGAAEARLPATLGGVFGSGSDDVWLWSVPRPPNQELAPIPK